MARYRKIDPRMWGDARFNRLSRLQPSGQALWLYLLTGPHTNCIPGLFRATEEGLAAELGWGLDGFRVAYADAKAEGMVEADWDAHVVSISNVIKYDSPTSINTIKAWRKQADDIPECELKERHLSRLYAFLDGNRESKAFAKAFAKAFGGSSELPPQQQQQPQPDLLPTEEDGRVPAVRSPKQKSLPLEAKLVATPKDGVDMQQGEAIYAVFQHWRDTYEEHKNAARAEARMAAVKRAIGWRREARKCSRREAVEEIKTAISAAQSDPFCSGNNRTGEPVTDLVSLLSVSVLEKLCALIGGNGTREPRVVKPAVESFRERDQAAKEQDLARRPELQEFRPAPDMEAMKERARREQEQLAAEEAVDHES